MRLKKIKNLKVRPGAQSSRFVIDLKLEPAATEAREFKNKNLIIESKLEKLAELNYKKYFGRAKSKAKTAALNFKNGFLKIGDSALALPAAAETWPIVRRPKPTRRRSKWLELSDQIFFISLAKLFLIIFIKFCYYFGWLGMFILRFAYFSLRALVNRTVQILIYLFTEFYRFDIKFFRLIFGGIFGFARALVKSVKAKKNNLAFSENNEVQEETVENYEEPIYQTEIDQPEPERKQISLESLPWRSGATPENLTDNGNGQLKEEQIPPTPLYQGGIAQRGGRFGFLRPAFVFAGVLLILVLPVKAFTYYKTLDSTRGKVLGASESAVNNLISGGRDAAGLNFNGADKSFSLAGDNFLIAENQLGEINSWLFTLASVIPNKNLQLAAASKHILKAGESGASAGKNLSLAVAGLVDYQAEDSQTILNDLSVYGRAAAADLSRLAAELDQINSNSLPEAYQQDFILLKQKIYELRDGLSEIVGLADDIKIIMGEGALKRYLLVFQNNSELRATGGFIGSYALVDFSNGKIKNIEVPGGGSYDTDAGLLQKIKSPEPLQLVRPDWHFWDANWWPDWPTSAAKLAWFYESSGGPTVDGVISFTPTVMEKILKVIGPIDLKDKYGVVIDADNFWSVTQEFSEQKPDVTKQPKKIIGDLMNNLIEVLPQRLNKSNLIGLLKAMEESLTDKNILFYFTDNSLEAKVQELGWGGSIKDTGGDYLSVINTNIAGGKSDRAIKQEISHQADVQADGTIIDSLTIKRTHQAVKRTPFVGVRNVDWLRIYVPLGAKLISATGFKPVDKIFFKEADPSWLDDPLVSRSETSAETDPLSGTKIYDELNKTVFANWSQVDPGETIEIKLEYQLPFKLTDRTAASGQDFKEALLAKTNAVINPEQKNLYAYSMLMQKQPGMNSSTITSELKLSDNFQPIWKFPADLGQSQKGWLANENFDQDILMAVMVEGEKL